jgi:hypothetical protein
MTPVMTPARTAGMTSVRAAGAPAVTSSISRAVAAMIVFSLLLAVAHRLDSKELVPRRLRAVQVTTFERAMRELIIRRFAVALKQCC